MSYVRLATHSDVTMLVELGRRVHAGTRFAAYDYNDLRVAANMTTLIEIGQEQDGTHAVFIAEDRRDSPVGVLLGAVERPIFSDLPVANVLVYYVFPEKRMTGAGFRLLTAFRRWAENRSAFEICVSINSGADLPRTERFLTRLGFRQTGGNFSLQAKSERPALNRAVTDEEY